MGTRSYIALQIEEDEYLTIFCHYNGYPDDNGAILAEHYDKQEKVESLIQLGDLYFLCNRPFATIEEMDETLIRNWNAKVTNGDTVYILGDLLFRNEKPAEEYLKQLKGKKHLIIGNHDRDWVKKCNLEDFFESVNNLHFISDGKRQMTLCHYPMMSWPHMTRCYMVFGHIHGNTDADYWPLIRENDLMLNAGADVNGFAPVTFEEMQENNYRHKAGWNPELCTMEADQ